MIIEYVAAGREIVAVHDDDHEEVVMTCESSEAAEEKAARLNARLIELDRRSDDA